MHVPILSLCGPYCVSPTDGARLYEQLAAALRSAASVCLDFSGVKVLTSRFAFAAIGSLYGAFAEADVDSRLSFAALDPVDAGLLHEVRAKAKKYYAAAPEVRARLREAENQLIANN